MNETEVVKDGRIRKAHPVWGWLMLSIPFLPMLVAPLTFVFVFGDSKGNFCNALACVSICAAPFTLIATPVYIIGVIFMGFRGFLQNKIGKNHKFAYLLRDVVIPHICIFYTGTNSS